MNFSVVIPLYNKEAEIYRTITSVLNQTIADFEVIVINDGSTDESLNIVGSFKDYRIRLITQPNRGVSAARNRGIEEASHELIAFIDADDEWYPNFLATVKGLVSKFPEAGLYCTAYVKCIDNRISRNKYRGVASMYGGEIVDDYFMSATQGIEVAWSSCVVVPKTVVEEVGGFPEEVSNGEDRIVWSRIALRYPIAWSPLECAVYHLSSGSQLHGTVLKEEAPMAADLEEALRSGEYTGTRKFWIEQYLALQRLNIALGSIRRGEKRLALHLLKQSIKLKFYWKRWIYTFLLTCFHILIGFLKKVSN
jgi:glycosyltransferase involved in cell wall biosynthesis